MELWSGRNQDFEMNFEEYSHLQMIHESPPANEYPVYPVNENLQTLSH
jgi:hypothetical protein